MYGMYSVYKNLVIFPGVGAFDHLTWTYDEAFEQLFGPGRGASEQKIPKKFKCPGGCPGGMLKLHFDWYITAITKRIRLKDI